MENQTSLQKIISQIKATVNRIAYEHMTEYAYIDPEKTLKAMREYNDETLGDYAFRTLISR